MANEKLVCKNVYKIFGPEPERAFDLLKQGKSKDEILKETGLTVGVQDTNFTVNQGEIFVVMGLSGSGKSTLIRMLNRLIDPTSGDIYIDGEEITGAEMEKVRDIRLRKMAMVFQHFALFPHKTVSENVEYGLKIQGVDEEERRKRALAALEQVGLAQWADRPPSALSGGMQQRVGLARGLAVDPEILLMDEPFSALDPLIRKDMQEELLQLQREVHKTIVFITHDLNEALILGDRIAIMKEGRFVQVGTPQDIVADPADDYVAAFCQDIDRGRVFDAEYVMVDPQALDLAKDTPQSALDRMDELGRHGLYALENGAIAGVVTYNDAARAALRGDKDLNGILHAEFPTTGPDTFLYEVYKQCSTGLPIAVKDHDGKFVGVVDPLQVFAMLTPDEEMPSEKEAAKAASQQRAAQGADTKAAAQA